MAVRTVHKTCNLCEAACGVLVEVEGNRVLGIKPDHDDPFSQGHICPKALSLKEIHEDPDRLKFPMKRTPTGWRRIGWDEALDEAARNLARIQAEGGRNAVAAYLGNPSVHNLGTALYAQLLLGVLHTRNIFSASSVDQNPKHASSFFLFGHILSIPVPDIDRTNYLLMLGANPIASNGSLMTAPGIRKRLRAIQKRGGKVVVVDPRRTETADLSDEHLFIRPGQDAFFLGSLLSVIFDDGLAKPAHAERLQGLERLRSLVAPLTPERVADLCGIEADTIRRIAREFASAKTAVCYGRIGTCLHPYGTLTSYLVDALNIVSGNFDRPGGAMFTTPAVDLVSLMAKGGRKGHLHAYKSRVRGANEFNGEFPVAILAEEMLTPGEGQVRGFVTIAGNPVLSTPNGRQLDKALAGLDYYVAVDIYINETTRHADLILPTTWSLEHDNYEAAFHVLAVRNTAKYSPQVVDEEPGMMHDWKLFTELAYRLAEYKAGNPMKRAAIRTARKAGLGMSPRRLIDTLLRIGPHGDGFKPWKKGLRLKDLEENPSGIDLGPLEPSLDRVLFTESGKIELDHPLIVGELERLAGRLEESATIGQGLVLIGRRDLRSNNSWGHNSKTMVKDGERCALLMNPGDAARLGLSGAARVRVRTRVGEVEAELKVTEEMMAGVVSLPHGWGHGREGVELSIAREVPGVSVNDLTDERLTEPVTGNAILNGVPVEVSAG